MVIGIDIDGVLANFESGFAPLLASLGPYTFPLESKGFPEVWDWPQKHGVSRAVLDQAWEQLLADPLFWRSLEPMPGATEALSLLHRAQRLGHDVYFITHRSGARAKAQTEEWLEMHGMRRPTVLLTGEKGLASLVLKLNAYIDDKTENCEDVADTNPSCRVYVFDRPYNQACRVSRRAFNLAGVLDRELRDLGDYRPGPDAGTAHTLSAPASNHHRYRV